MIEPVLWYHSFDLPNGEMVKGAQPIEYCQYAANTVFDCLVVTGKSVLDIATWTGYHAFEAERRAARQVVAIDDLAWRLFNGQENFNYVHKQLKSKVTSAIVPIPSLAKWFEGVGVFDIILCLGLIYHVRNPITLFELLGKYTIECAVIETHLDMVDYPRPAMVYYSSEDHGRENANYFGPNVAMVRELLLDNGFKRVEVTPNKYHQAPNNWRAFFHAYK